MTPKEAWTIRRSLLRQARRAARSGESWDARTCTRAAFSIRHPTTVADLAEHPWKLWLVAPTWTRRQFLGVFADWYARPCTSTIAFGLLRWDATDCKAVRA